MLPPALSSPRAQMPIFTTKGLIDDSLLEKREGTVDNDRENTTWVEYWLEGELVHRSAHVTIKPASAFAVAGEIAQK